MRRTARRCAHPRARRCGRAGCAQPAPCRNVGIGEHVRDQVRPHEGRRDHVDVDAVRRPLRRELLAQDARDRPSRRNRPHSRARAARAACARDPMWTCFPPPCAIMCRAAACAWNIALFRFASHHVIPALLVELLGLRLLIQADAVHQDVEAAEMRATCPPSGGCRPRRGRRTARRSRRSHSAHAFAFSALRPATATFAPSSASPRHTAAPMPP